MLPHRVGQSLLASATVKKNDPTNQTDNVGGGGAHLLRPLSLSPQQKRFSHKIKLTPVGRPGFIVGVPGVPVPS